MIRPAQIRHIEKIVPDSKTSTLKEWETVVDRAAKTFTEEKMEKHAERLKEKIREEIERRESNDKREPR